jgi:hypothetical protein
MALLMRLYGSGISTVGGRDGDRSSLCDGLHDYSCSCSQAMIMIAAWLLRYQTEAGQEQTDAGGRHHIRADCLIKGIK